MKKARSERQERAKRHDVTADEKACVAASMRAYRCGKARERWIEDREEKVAKRICERYPMKVEVCVRA